MILNSNKLKRLKFATLLFLLLSSTNLLAVDNSNSDQESFNTASALGGISWDDLCDGIKRPGYSWQELLSMMFSTKSVSQYALHKKILSYLQSGLSKIPQERKEYIAANLRSGYCGGYSTLWVYSKWLQIKKPGLGDKYGPVTIMEDKDWMASNIILIAEWDKKTLNEEEINSLDDFISTLDYFQDPTRFSDTHPTQGHLNKILYDTNKGYPNKEYFITALLTLKQLKQLLNTKNFIQDGKLILISSHNHMTALFKNEHNYYYFDPDNPEGEITTQSIDYVAEYIFYTSFGPSWLNDHNTPSPLSFSIFSFDKNSLPYPPVKELLESINPALFPEKNFKYHLGGKMDSVLQFAQRRNDIESMQYYLEKHYILNIPIVGDETYVFSLPYVYNNFNIDIKQLLRSPNVDVNSPDLFGRTLLMLAISKDDRDMIELLLAHPKIDVNSINKDGDSALNFAIGYGNCEIVKLLLSSKKTCPNIINKIPLFELYRKDNCNTCIFKELLKNPDVDVNLPGERGWTLLMLAISKNDRDIIELLLAHPKINVNSIDQYRNSALDIAKHYNNYEIVKLLLSSAANLGKRSEG